MASNNFKRLLATEEERITPLPLQEIKQNLSGSMSVFKFFGQIVELYLPKVFELFVAAVGGSDTESAHGPAKRDRSSRRSTVDNDPGPVAGI